jgi:hypothetical protein
VGQCGMVVVGWTTAIFRAEAPFPCAPAHPQPWLCLLYSLLAAELREERQGGQERKVTAQHASPLRCAAPASSLRFPCRASPADAGSSLLWAPLFCSASPASLSCYFFCSPHAPFPVAPTQHTRFVSPCCASSTSAFMQGRTLERFGAGGWLQMLCGCCLHASMLHPTY